MAKNKGVTGAAKRASKKQTAEGGPVPDPGPLQTEDGRIADGRVTDDQSLIDGIVSTRLITEVIRPEVETAVKAAFGGALKGDLLRSLISSIADVLKPLREEIADLYCKIDEIPKPPTQESIHRLADDRIKQASVNAERRQMWATEWWEDDHRSSVRTPPRPSIVGRAMHELQTATNGKALKPAGIFEHIEKRGAHHLPSTVRELLRKYKTSGSGTKKKDASGKLGTHLHDRLKGLVAGLLALDKKGDLRLTDRGLLVFNGWPDWSVRGDDIECQGRAEYTAGATESAADDGRQR